MAKQERNRKSAPQNRAKSFADAVRGIEAPLPMIPEELERFDAIIVSRERDTWTPTDIFAAARLAQLEIEAEILRDEYQREGARIEDHTGKLVTNPTFTAYHTTLKAINDQRRQLGLSASQKGISGSKQAKRNQQDVQAREKVSAMPGLIATPDAPKS